jgi:hypothetical protein
MFWKQKTNMDSAGKPVRRGLPMTGLVSIVALLLCQSTVLADEFSDAAGQLLSSVNNAIKQLGEIERRGFSRTVQELQAAANQVEKLAPELSERSGEIESLKSKDHFLKGEWEAAERKVSWDSRLFDSKSSTIRADLASCQSAAEQCGKRWGAHLEGDQYVFHYPANKPPPPEYYSCKAELDRINEWAERVKKEAEDLTANEGKALIEARTTASKKKAEYDSAHQKLDTLGSTQETQIASFQGLMSTAVADLNQLPGSAPSAPLAAWANTPSDARGAQTQSDGTRNDPRIVHGQVETFTERDNRPRSGDPNASAGAELQSADANSSRITSAPHATDASDRSGDVFDTFGQAAQPLTYTVVHGQVTAVPAESGRSDGFANNKDYKQLQQAVADRKQEYQKLEAKRDLLQAKLDSGLGDKGQNQVELANVKSALTAKTSEIGVAQIKTQDWEKAHREIDITVSGAAAQGDKKPAQNP